MLKRRHLYELQGFCIRGSLIVYFVVPRVIYAKSRHAPTMSIVHSGPLRSYEVYAELDLNI